MDATNAWLNVRLDDREGHARGLTLVATRLLRAGQPRRAFELADRRCRLDEAPGAADRAIRALAGRLCGWPFWREDLAAASRADPLDLVVNATLLRLGTDAERRQAALCIVSSHEASTNALQDALTHLFQSGDAAVTRLDLVDDRLSGWVIWRGEGRATLTIEGTSRTHRLALTEDPGWHALPSGARGAQVEALLPFERVRRYTVDLEERELASGGLASRSRRGDHPSRSRASARTPDRAPLVVLVPVYEDLGATTACLDAAISEVSARANTRLVVVDDASPNADLVRHLDGLAEENRIELKRCDVNLGFAGAVRLGLTAAGGGDVLLLNADALLPKGAIDRLVEAAYGAPDIGTVTPLSNNGEYTSFPRPGVANPVPSSEDARRIDEIASRLGLGVVDLPTGTGFCLYLRHDCRDAVGEMPAIYGRGYFEDMEFCLRARESGFRNVCTPSVFVVHHGSLSFGAGKGALVSKNLRILRQRFPQTRADCAAHVAADPLRTVRGAIEAEMPLEASHPLIVARDGGALLSSRLVHHGGNAVQLLWSTSGGRPGVRVVGSMGSAPQSLRFDLDAGDHTLRAYLGATAFERVEILGGDEPPRGLVEVLLHINSPIDLVLGDVPMEADPGADPLLGALATWAAHPGARLRRIVAADGQSLAALRDPRRPVGGDIVDGRPRPDAAEPYAFPDDAPRSIGILCPAPISASDAFVRTLSAVLHRRRSPARLVVLGRAVDDLALMARGNVFVTGALEPEEEGDILRLLGVRALVLPPSSPFLAEGERIAGRFALPFARADWTLGGPLPSPSSLFLDPQDRDEGNALSIADWFAHRLEAPAT